MENLAGRSAVITGGANGIGRGTALALARRGVGVMLADMDAEGLTATAAEISKHGGSAAIFECELRDETAFVRLREAALVAFGQVDIVMNNAGVLASGDPLDIPIEEWRRVFDINFFAMIRSNEVFLPELIAKGSGHIVNTASFAALYPYAYDRLPYMTSKAAVIALTEGLALYARPKGVGVTLLAPGPVKTQIVRTMRQWGQKPLAPGLPSHFKILEPEAVGEMVVDAIERDIFFLPTDHQVMDIVREQSTDPEAFIRKQIAWANRAD